MQTQTKVGKRAVTFTSDEVHRILAVEATRRLGITKPITANSCINTSFGRITNAVVTIENE